MSSRTFLIVALSCLLLAAVSLVLADALGAPIFALIGAGAVLAGIAARESWQWQGRGRQWLLMAGAIGVVVAVAFIASTLSS